MDNPGKCSRCGKGGVERCGGDHCRDCHVSLSWEDCVDGTYSARVLLRAGARTRDDLLEQFPEARI